jgi:hypothetical protein
MKLIDVKVQNVEFVRELARPVKHQHIVGNWIAHIGIQAQRRGHAAHQVRGRN